MFYLENKLMINIEVNCKQIRYSTQSIDMNSYDCYHSLCKQAIVKCY